jgi:hypothetical protein
MLLMSALLPIMLIRLGSLTTATLVGVDPLAQPSASGRQVRQT